MLEKERNQLKDSPSILIYMKNKTTRDILSDQNPLVAKLEADLKHTFKYILIARQVPGRGISDHFK